MCYLTASLLFEGSGDERGTALDDRHVFYPPALGQLGVGGYLDQLQAHLLPQRPRQASELSLSFGQVHGHLSVLPTVLRHLPESLWDATNYSMRETAVRAHVGHDVTNPPAWMVITGSVSLSLEQAAKRPTSVYIRGLVKTPVEI